MSPDVNWTDLVQRLLPRWWRRMRMLAWMRVLVSQVAAAHSVFLNSRSRVLYDLRINGQTIYLEKALNDRFDEEPRRIYIETIEDPSQLYLYRKAEEGPPLFLYPKWSAGRFFFVGAFAIHNGAVWECLIAGSGVEPVDGSPSWSFHKDFDTYIRRKGESLQGIDFIVYVPIELVFDEAEMRALIERYRQAGKRYTIETY